MHGRIHNILGMLCIRLWSDVTKHSEALLLLQVHDLMEKNIVPSYLVAQLGFNFTIDLYLQLVQHVDTTYLPKI